MVRWRKDLGEALVDTLKQEGDVEVDVKNERVLFATDAVLEDVPIKERFLTHKGVWSIRY